METDLKALLLVILCVKSITCYSNGKVTSACTDMIPSHGHNSSPNPPPYSVTVEKNTFSPGDQIKVTLSALPPDGSVYFKGFFIQARNAASPDTGAIGEFALVDSHISQLLRCNNREASAVSHTSGSHKTKVEAIWKAPQDSPPSVQFIVTVVQKYSLYWVKIPGPVISVNGASPLPSLSTAEAGTTTTSGRLPQRFTSEGCGTTKSCIRDPEGCNPQIDSLCYFLSFRKEDGSVMFELSGPASGYVSFALSTDEWMGNDDVYLCVRETEHVAIGAAYVEGRTHPIMASKNVLRDTKWQLLDGVIYCSFRRNIQIPSPNDNRFDLDKMYYLFLANGRQDDGRIHRHDRQPLISSKKVVLTGPSENLTGSRAPLLIKFHAAFMLIGWMMTVSTGAIIARYFKPDWPETTLCGQKVWFQFHRGLMLLTVLLTCIGFILPFVYRGGWSKRAGSHPYLGCSVMALAIIQPITALFRPAPDSSRRCIFNWAHLCIGTLTQVLAVVAIFFGIHQQALLLPAPWTTGLLAGCIIWFVLADLTLEVHRRGLFPLGRIFKNIQVHTERRQMEDKEQILVVQSENESYMKGFYLKKIIFVVYLCGNLIFVAVLLGTISGV